VNKQVDDLIDILQDGDEWEAAKAAETLGQLRAKKAVPALIIALHSQDLLQDWNALDTMTKIAFGGVGEGITAIETLRCAAAQALGEIGDERAVPELLAVFNSEGPDIHVDAIKALANFSSPEAIAAVDDYIEKAITDAQSDDISLRFEGVVRLGHVPMERNVPILINALDDQSHLVRKEAAKALGEVGQKVEDRKLKAEIVLALEARLSDTDTLKRSMPRVCDLAAEALEKMGTEDAMTVVRKWRQEQQAR
jgi:HEAT repeat protein